MFNQIAAGLFGSSSAQLQQQQLSGGLFQFPMAASVQLPPIGQSGSLAFRISREMLRDDLYWAAMKRTGISEVQPGVPARNFKRKSLSETESYPPKDWPNYP